MENELEQLKRENLALREQLKMLKEKRGKHQKSGMIFKAEKGKPMSRPPFGYKIKDNRLVLDLEKSKIVEDIFLEFQNSNISLNKLSKKYNLSLNGLKKVLTNFTYLGKIKFNGEIHASNHEPLISATLFNQVQNKLENLRKNLLSPNI